MGVVVAILKGVDLALAGLQVADKALTKVKMWKRKRRILKAIKAKRNHP